ncbi:anti-sigma factor [Pseudomonas sp. D(2018)]|uniref:anti-sigma factor n=1 Tax=Pseudomonas sp. D(2018) TaxID=2502238 RepID=UPI0010F6ECEA|nr:anti-sigma factor [Pseudomonas sp. D(2018)]
MLNCREMAELGSAIVDHQVDLRTRLAVYLHLRLCARCRLYIRQLRLTSDTLKQLPLKLEPVDTRSILDAIRKPDQPG